jgi:predicted nucleic acid-binding protein
MIARAFFDTNVLVYFYSEAGENTQLAEDLLIQGGVVSVQVLNELVSVMSRKLGMTWEEVRSARDKALVFCPSPISLTEDIHREAVDIAARYGFTIYDSLILAAALQAKCSTVYTEDLQHGQIVEGLRIVNPFLQ